MTDDARDFIEELEELVDRYDATLKFEKACMTGWAGQLRLTLTNPHNEPSRSITFYSVGGIHPDEIAFALLEDVRKWFAESDIEPMPVPDWMKFIGGDAE